MFTTNETTFNVLQDAVEILNKKMTLIKEAKGAMDTILDRYTAITENYKEYAEDDTYFIESLAHEIDDCKYVIDSLFGNKWRYIWDAITDIDDIVQGRTIYNEDIDTTIVDINGHELSK